MRDLRVQGRSVPVMRHLRLGGVLCLELSVIPDGVLDRGLLEARGCRDVKGQITVSALRCGHPLACIFRVAHTFVVALSKRVRFHLAHHLVGGHQVRHSLVGIHELEAAHVRPRQHGQVDGTRAGVRVIKVIESVLHLARLNALSVVLLHSSLVRQGVIQVL